MQPHLSMVNIMPDTASLPTPEDARREYIKVMIDLKGQSVMNLLVNYVIWDNQLAQSIKIDYRNLTAWLRGTQARLSPTKQVAFESFLGLDGGKLQEGVVHSWQPTLSASDLKKHLDIIKRWLGSEPVVIWDIGRHPGTQQIVRIVKMNTRLVRISAVSSLWEVLLPVMGVSESQIRYLPTKPSGDHYWQSCPLDFGAVSAGLIAIDRLEQVHNSADQIKDNTWLQLIKDCGISGISPREARKRIFNSSMQHPRYQGSDFP